VIKVNGLYSSHSCATDTGPCFVSIHMRTSIALIQCVWCHGVGFYSLIDSSAPFSPVLHELIVSVRQSLHRPTQCVSPVLCCCCYLCCVSWRSVYSWL